MFCKFFKKKEEHKNISSSEYQTIKKNVVNKIKDNKDANLSLDDINPHNVINILTYVIAIIDSFKKDISGSDKKQLVLNITYDVVQNSSIPAENKKYILDMLDNVFDPFVENIIAVSKGKFDINKTKSIFKSCASCLYKNSSL